MLFVASFALFHTLLQQLLWLAYHLFSIMSLFSPQKEYDNYEPTISTEIGMSPRQLRANPNDPKASNL